MKKFLFFCATLIVAINVSATITTMTCAEATQYIMDSLQSGQTGTDSVAITGYVTSTNSIISRGQQTFWLDDTKGSAQTFQAYRCNIPSGEEALNVGDKVTIRGFLSRFNDIAEMKEGDTEILERAIVHASVCEALEEGASLNDRDYSDDVFKVYGRLKGADQVNNNGKHTFEMACGESIFKPYNCNGAEGLELGKGDSVVVTGKLYNFYGTIEISNGTVELIEKSQEEEVIISANVAEAVAAAMALPNSGITADRYAITGYVYSITSAYNAGFGNISFFMTDDMANPTYNFYAYRVKCTAAEAELITIGCLVTVTAALQHYYQAEDVEKQLPEINRAETVAGGTATVLPSFSMTFAGDPITGGDVQQISIVNVTTNERLIEAFPNYGYHFAQWSDGNTDNPRIVTLTQDTTFIAEFARNSYTVTVVAANIEEGKTEELSALYLDEVEISATPNYGYHFVQWSDGNTDNPRIVTLTQDTTFTAEFNKNTYFVRTESANTLMGNTAGDGHALYLDEVEISATSNYGYHFSHWSDGNTNNPRTIVLTQDTTFIAEFALDRRGTCGDNNALTWSYNPNDQTLAITGNGTLNSNYTFGLEATAEMQKLVIAEGVTAIGNNAFSNISTLVMIQLPASLKTIGAKAFENCIDLMYIYNYRERPCIVDATAFDGVNKFDCTLYVLEGSVDMYKSAGSNWKDFYFILPIGSTTVTEPVSDVIVEPADNTATVTWPTNDNAVSYTIEITKDGEVFCTLIFNANGQLTGIAFAPSRDGQAHAPAAVMTANGLQFTVTGLNSNTQYGYSVTAKDSSDATIASYSGNFTTTGEGVATGVEEISSSLQGGDRGRLILRNGQIFILRGDKTYTLTGTEVK